MTGDLVVFSPTVSRRNVLRTLGGLALKPELIPGIASAVAEIGLPLRTSMSPGQAIAISEKAGDFLWQFAECGGKLNHILYTGTPEHIRAKLARYAAGLKRALTDWQTTSQFVVKDLEGNGPISKVLALHEAKAWARYKAAFDLLHHAPFLAEWSSARDRLTERHRPGRINSDNIEQIKTYFHSLEYDVSVVFPSPIAAKAKDTDRKITEEFDSIIASVTTPHGIDEDTFSNWWYMRDSFSIRNMQAGGNFSSAENLAFREATDVMRKELSQHLEYTSQNEPGRYEFVHNIIDREVTFVIRQFMPEFELPNYGKASQNHEKSQQQKQESSPSGQTDEAKRPSQAVRQKDLHEQLLDPPPLNESGSGVILDRFRTLFMEQTNGEEEVHGGADHRAFAAC